MKSTLLAYLDSGKYIEQAVMSPLGNTCISVNLSDIGGIFAIGFATRGVKLCNEDYSDRNYKEKQNIQKQMMATCNGKT